MGLQEITPPTSIKNAALNPIFIRKQCEKLQEIRIEVEENKHIYTLVYRVIDAQQRICGTKALLRD